ncbi:MAG: hypothetical protein AB1846_06905, partial [Chloroflexota bacterium]
AFPKFQNAWNLGKEKRKETPPNSKCVKFGRGEAKRRKTPQIPKCVEFGGGEEKRNSSKFQNAFLYRTDF